MAKKTTKSASRTRKARSPKGRGLIAIFERGTYVRTYSKDVHGSDYSKLASEFISKTKPKVRIAKDINKETLEKLEAEKEAKREEEEKKLHILMKLA